MTERSLLLVVTFAMVAGCSSVPSDDSSGLDGGSMRDATADGGSTDASGEGTDAGVADTSAWDAADAGAPTIVTWPSAACQAQTASLLTKMSRLQKAAQMVSG